MSLDYLFSGQRTDERPLTVLNTKDEERGKVTCTAVPKKSGNYPAVWLSECLRLLGYPEVLMKSDGEPSIIDVKNRAKTLCKDTGIKITFQESPVGDSQANGNIEGTNRMLIPSMNSAQGLNP